MFGLPAHDIAPTLLVKAFVAEVVAEVAKSPVPAAALKQRIINFAERAGYPRNTRDHGLFVEHVRRTVAAAIAPPSPVS